MGVGVARAKLGLYLREGGGRMRQRCCPEFVFGVCHHNVPTCTTTSVKSNAPCTHTPLRVPPARTRTHRHTYQLTTHKHAYTHKCAYHVLRPNQTPRNSPAPYEETFTYTPHNHTVRPSPTAALQCCLYTP